ncbi:MAG: BrnA antitoxin family protein [Gammaproteobacteria bacterium]
MNAHQRKTGFVYTIVNTQIRKPQAEVAMARGFFSRFTRSTPTEARDPAVAEIARQIARQGFPESPRKAAISLRLDADVLAWFKAQGPGYQTRINAVLRAYKEAAG